MDQPAESLLKYSNPVLSVTESPKDQPQKRANNDPDPVSLQSTYCGDGNSKRNSRTILNTILSPRQWLVGDQLWKQEVSPESSTRLDVIHLEEELDKKLQQRQARQTGVCLIRRELYLQCFDEIIRQLTVECTERGLLLLRIKDEYERTLNTYVTLHGDSVAFDTNRELQAEQKGADMKKTISELENERDDLTEQLNEQKDRCAKVEEGGKDKAQLQEKRHSEEIEFLRNINQQLKAQLAEKIEPE